MQCSAGQCSAVQQIKMIEMKKKKGEVMRGEDRGGEGNMMIGRSLSLALRIIWLHAIAWGL